MKKTTVRLVLLSTCALALVSVQNEVFAYRDLYSINAFAKGTVFDGVAPLGGETTNSTSLFFVGDDTEGEAGYEDRIWLNFHMPTALPNSNDVNPATGGAILRIGGFTGSPGNLAIGISIDPSSNSAWTFGTIANNWSVASGQSRTTPGGWNGSTIDIDVTSWFSQNAGVFSGSPGNKAGFNQDLTVRLMHGPGTVDFNMDGYFLSGAAPTFQLIVQTVPEPASLSLATCATVGATGLVRRFRKRRQSFV
jgi:hypothetical protein